MQRVRIEMVEICKNIVLMYVQNMDVHIILTPQIKLMLTRSVLLYKRLLTFEINNPIATTYKYRVSQTVLIKKSTYID